MMQTMISKIQALKEREHAVILAHTYVVPEIQDVADFVGDSLELSRKARDNRAETIIFCGVRFMGETAKLLCPQARVVMPTGAAGCPMADSCVYEGLRAWKADHPDHMLVAYVNTTAATKSLVDICVTSGNAERIVQKLDKDRPIMFLPDRNLGANLNRRLGLNMELWNGCCWLHNGIRVSDIERAKAAYPDAEVIVHLECQPEVVDMADAALSTAGMLCHVEKSQARRFIVGTECGMLHRLEVMFPDRVFVGLEPSLVCHNMKKNTLENLVDALEGRGYEITLPEEIMVSAVRPIERMLEWS